MGHSGPMNSRNQSLYVLRFLAILLVLLDHYDYLPGTASGWIGVDLFFVLSGFLISGLLFEQLCREVRFPFAGDAVQIADQENAQQELRDRSRVDRSHCSWLAIVRAQTQN